MDAEPEQPEQPEPEQPEQPESVPEPEEPEPVPAPEKRPRGRPRKDAVVKPAQSTPKKKPVRPVKQVVIAKQVEEEEEEPEEEPVYEDPVNYMARMFMQHEREERERKQNKYERLLGFA